MCDFNNEYETNIEYNYLNNQNETSEESSVQQTLPPRVGISKGRSLEKLIIPDSAFDQASKLSVGMQFENWNHANLVLLAYGQQIGFVWRIQDKYLDKNGEAAPYLKNVLYPIKKRWAKCFTFKEFNAGMFSTQRVESINAIIHKFMNSHSTLLKCFNGLQEMLASELQKAEYRDYLANLPFIIASSSAIRVFPKLVENLRSVLTDEVFSIQKTQIDVCFEYYSKLIPSDQYHMYNNINDFDTSVCLEDCTDKCQIALKSLISDVNLTNVIEIWEVKHMAVNTTSVNYVALFQDHSHICTCLLLTSEGLSRWYKKGVDLQKINALDKSANFVIDTGSESSLTFICEIHINEEDLLSNNSEVEHFINKRQIYGECAALGRKLASLASEFNLAHIAATLRGLIQEVKLSNNPVNKQDQEMIRNPLQVNAKGRPAKRLKSSGENSMGNRSINRSGDGYTLPSQ
ncbi:7519_t:CDS:2, partial [Rhizophagus irregularis]